MTEIEKAYLAGIIDGEGTITLTKDGDFRYPTLTFCNNDKAIIDYVNTFCQGIVSIKRSSNKNPEWHDNWIWRIDHRRAIEVLEQIVPYLHEQKKLHRAQAIIRNYLRLTPRNGRYSKELREEKLRWQEAFFEIE